MKCGFCGGELIWSNDFDALDIGWDKDGIVTQYNCSECGAMWEGILLDEDEDEEIKGEVE